MNGAVAANISILPATGEHAELLSKLALRSKAHWGYDAEFMNACRAELTYTAQDIEAFCYEFFLCCDEESLVGFHALNFDDPRNIELEALFVEPEFIGCGFGRLLLEHAIERARRRGARALIIQSDPHAERFYHAAGACRAGNRESSSIPGRLLPLFRIALT